MKDLFDSMERQWERETEQSQYEKDLKIKEQHLEIEQRRDVREVKTLRIAYFSLVLSALAIVISVLAFLK